MINQYEVYSFIKKGVIVVGWVAQHETLETAQSPLTLDLDSGLSL